MQDQTQLSKLSYNKPSKFVVIGLLSILTGLFLIILPINVINVCRIIINLIIGLFGYSAMSLNSNNAILSIELQTWLTICGIVLIFSWVIYLLKIKAKNIGFQFSLNLILIIMQITLVCLCFYMIFNIHLFSEILPLNENMLVFIDFLVIIGVLVIIYRMDRSKEFWDMISDIYDDNEKKFEQTYNKVIENTKKYLTVNDIVLDFACGTGIPIIEIAGNVKEIQAIDISSKMITVAKRKTSERKITNINYSQSTIFNDRYKKESFDVILSFGILHLLKDTQKFIQRINELLKPGGFFISGTPCLGQNIQIPRIISFLLSELLFLLSKIGFLSYLNFCKFSDLEGLVVEGNFNIIETESIPFESAYMFIVARK